MRHGMAATAEGRRRRAAHAALGRTTTRRDATIVFFDEKVKPLEDLPVLGGRQMELRSGVTGARSKTRRESWKLVCAVSE